MGCNGTLGDSKRHELWSSFYPSVATFARTGGRKESNRIHFLSDGGSIGNTHTLSSLAAIRRGRNLAKESSCAYLEGPTKKPVCFSMPDAMSGMCPWLAQHVMLALSSPASQSMELVGRLLCNCCIHSLVQHLGMTHRQEASAILFVQNIYTQVFFSSFFLHSLILESLRSIIWLCHWRVKNSRRFESSCAATSLPLNS
jgi:hypothetical protein